MSVFLIYISLTFTHSQEGDTMPTHFTKHRGNGTPSVLNIEWDRSPYSLACPQCGFEYVHVEHVRIADTGGFAPKIPV